MRNLLLSLALISLYSANSLSQIAKFNYQTELCECKASFDSTKYSRQELRNTIDHLWWSSGIPGEVTAWKLDEIKDLSTEKITEEFLKKMSIYQNLPFVQDTFWTRLKTELIEYYTAAHKLMTITILAYENPDTLMSYDLVDSKCIFYRDALIAGGSELLSAWKVLVDFKKSQNGNPDRLQRMYDEQLASTQKYDFARLDIMKFGWWNSANHMLPHIDQSYRYQDNFERLFKHYRCECEEP